MLTNTVKNEKLQAQLQQIFEFSQLSHLFQKQVEITQKSAEAGCLKLLSFLNFSCFYSEGCIL